MVIPSWYGNQSMKGTTWEEVEVFPNSQTLGQCIIFSFDEVVRIGLGLEPISGTSSLYPSSSSARVDGISLVITFWQIKEIHLSLIGILTRVRHNYSLTLQTTQKTWPYLVGLVIVVKLSLDHNCQMVQKLTHKTQSCLSWIHTHNQSRFGPELCDGLEVNSENLVVPMLDPYQQLN